MTQTTKLNNNNSIPSIGFGTWKLSGDNVGNSIITAIKAGYRHIDCASIYGNEKEIGEALVSLFKEGIVRREELFITSKLWNTDHNPNNVEKACRKTLSDLQLDCLDLYLVHWGVAFQHGGDLEPLGEDGLVLTESVSIQETWKAMESLVEKSLVKSIGVANFTTAMIIDLLSHADIKPVMNQIEIHPYNSQVELVKFCHKKEIAVTAYSPLGSSGDSEDRPITDNTVMKIAQEHGVTSAQVLIKWLLERGIVVIPRSSNENRIKENFNILELELSEQEIEQIDELNKNHRFIDPVEWWGFPYFK